MAGALSMAAGEYVSVSSQADVEHADLERERRELQDNPDTELEELTQIYEHRGLRRELAQQVAAALTAHNALETHARDELGINEITQAKPFQAALASAFAFLSGGLLPLLVSIFAPVKGMVWWQYGLAIVFLAVSGSVAARTGGSSLPKAILRICFWGTFAMLMSALVGHLFNVSVS